MPFAKLHANDKGQEKREKSGAVTDEK